MLFDANFNLEHFFLLAGLIAGNQYGPQTASDMNSLMNTREAAEYLKLHYVTLYKLAQQGHIPASKIGGAWRFNKDILDRWLAQQSLGVLGNVLIVDDDPAILEMLSDIVSREEYKAVAVESGEKALEELQKQQFDLIFLDLLLPGMSGLEILKALKKTGIQVSVAILTGYADDPMADEALSLGPKFLIRKPFRVSEIIEVINSLSSPVVQEEGKTEGQQVLSHFLGPKRQRQRTKVGEPDTRHPSEPDEAKFREMLDQLPEIIFEADIQGNFVYANRIALDSFGYSPEDMERGVNILQLVAPEDRDKAKNSIMRLLSGEDLGANEYIVRRKDGSEFPAMVHSSLLTDDEGHAVGFRGMVIRLGTSDQLEEMLWESEEERRIVFNSIGDAIVVTDLSGHILKANDAAAHMVRLPDKEQLIGRNAFNFISAKDRPIALDTLKDGRIDGAVSGQIEYVLVTADGNEFNADVGVSLLRDVSGKPTGFIGVARDITERKRAEDILRQSEEDYRTLFESTIDGMAVIDYETMKVVLANETAFKMYGFDPKDEIDKINLLDHVHTDDREAVIESLAKDMFVKNLRKVVEFRTLTKDGQIKWVSGLGTRFKYHGKTAGLISFRDITEQKRFEYALRESEERCRMLVDNTQEMVQSVAPDGRFLFVNKTWHKTLGYTKKDLESLTLHDIIHPDSLEHCSELFQKVLKGETVNRIEAVFKAKNGSEIYVEGNASPRWLNSTIVGTMGFFRGVTERKRKSPRE
jgi:PAS domain S-box-containing protein/excisionase family DNA binding protein